MNWQITFRSTDGNLVHQIVEAPSRGEALKAAQKNNIRVICLQAVENKRKYSLSLKSRIVKFVVAFCCVVCLCILVNNLHCEKKPAEQSKPKSTLKEKTTKPVVPSIKQEHHKKIDLEPITKLQEAQYFGKHRVEVDNNGDRWIIRNGEKRKILSASSGTTRQLFTNRAENQLSALLTVKPGDMIVGFEVDDLKFTADFLESLKMPIVITEEDSEEERQEKELVIEAKQNLLRYYKEGLNIAQIVKDEYREICKLNALKADLSSKISELRSNGASSEEIELHVAASNELLKKYGIEHQFKLMRHERMTLTK